MASFEAHLVRACSIELRDRTLTLYMAVNAIYQGTNEWVLNGLDPMLPAPFDVRSQLAQYKALKLEALKLSEWVTMLLEAQPGDTLSYPPPPSESGLGVYFDENLIFHEDLFF
jgi:hypothetical protein